MTQSSPFLTLSDTVLWLKVTLTAAMLVLLYFRYKSRAAVRARPLRTKLTIGLAVLFSFAVFHNLGTFRGESFVHNGEMFHYYLGAKYFKELGYYELYNAVIVADAEQDNALAALPFYTDLTTYRNIPRESALRDVARIKRPFSEQRWAAFKSDVAFFKTAAAPPHTPGLMFLLMDHGYNASPASTFVLGLVTNLIPVSQMPLLASLDVFLVVAMMVLVFRTFGFDMGALFSGYFFVSVLSGQEYLSGSLLRYDWLFYIVVGLCLLEKRRYASSACFLTLSAMMRIFPAVLFYGLAVTMVQKVMATRKVEQKYLRFTGAAGVTALVLFLLPAASLGSVLRPWTEFASKLELHDSGVYVNHLGLRGIVLFEPSHLSLEKFVATFRSAETDDIVRHWQDVKEGEFRNRRPAIVVSSLLVLIALTAIIWKRKDSDVESALWPMLLVYTTSYLSHYYYAFLCLFVLLFFRRVDSLTGLVPLCLLLILNVSVLVTDYCRPSPIVFFTLVNIYLFICLTAIIAFELFANVFTNSPIGLVAASDPLPKPGRGGVKRRRQSRARGKS